MNKKLYLTFLMLALFVNLALFSVSIKSKSASHEVTFKVPYADYLVDVAQDTWRGISRFMCNETGLPFDRSDPGNPQTSLNNIGLYLACVVGAYDLGFINRAEAVQRLNLTLSSLLTLEVWHGFPYEWLNAITLKRIWTNYVSTVSIGWYTAGIITARAAFPEVKNKCDQLLAPMDWSKLYNPGAGFFYTYFDRFFNSYSGSCYTDLTVESRMASFVAIGTEQVPASHWDNLRREMETREGIQFLSGWSGGLFMYFMPGIFIDERCSFIGRSAANITRAQMLFAKRNNYSVWGFSPSDIPGGGYGFSESVVTPHASIDTVYYYPSEVIRNMQELEKMGVRPEGYGFRDSVDMISGQVDNSYLVLDQGMIFLSLSNYLNGTIWRYFNSDPIAIRAKELISDYQISDEAKQSYKTIFEDVTNAILFAEYEGLNVTIYLSDLMAAKMAYNAGKYTEAVSATELIMQEKPILASSRVWNATLIIQSIADEGFNVSLAEMLLTEARAAFDAENYTDAAIKANEASVMAQRSKEAGTVINEAEEIVGGIADEGFNATLAESLLADARVALNAGNFTGAVALANEAVVIAQKSKEAGMSINGAEEAIEKAEMEGRTQGLDQARELLQQAMMKYDLGEYDEAKDLADQAKILADQATPEPPNLANLAIVGSVLVIGCAVGLLYYFKKIKGKPREPSG